jgi:phosphatidylinositol-3-phosphatase
MSIARFSWVSTQALYLCHQSDENPRHKVARQNLAGKGEDGIAMRALSRLGLSLLLSIWTLATAASAQNTRFDHIYVIVLENHGFDDALFNGPSPFMRELAETQGLATHYFGVAHPSLPNYLTLIGGDDFGVRDDQPSCFASDIAPSTACHKIADDSLVDQMGRAGLSFAVYAESLPAPGALVSVAPGGIQGPLYAQKHNPLPYFSSLAADPVRESLIKPYEAFAPDLARQAPNVALIVPNQCHDGHGLTVCHDRDRLIADYDAFVRDAVTAIRGSQFFTRRSAIIVTFDEGARSVFPEAQPSESARAVGGADNHIATLVVTACGAPVRDATRYDHFSLLATIEDGFALPRLRKAAGAPAMDDLFADRCAP